MSSYQNEVVKKWTPKVALAVLGIFLLLILWGVVNFVIRFFEAGSYFSVSSSDTVADGKSTGKRDQEINDFFNERAKKRQTINTLDISQENGQKDPFNLP